MITVLCAISRVYHYRPWLVGLPQEREHLPTFQTCRVLGGSDTLDTCLHLCLSTSRLAMIGSASLLGQTASSAAQIMSLLANAAQRQTGVGA